MVTSWTEESSVNPRLVTSSIGGAHPEIISPILNLESCSLRVTSISSTTSRWPASGLVFQSAFAVIDSMLARHNPLVRVSSYHHRDTALQIRPFEPQLNWGGQSPSSSPRKQGRGSQPPALGADQPFQFPQGAVITASTEEDWISPFTLPPVPSIKSSRRISNPFSSPPQHRKSSSGAYYAAAWGSPITPETRRYIASSISPDNREDYGLPVEPRRSERGNWFSDSEGSGRGSPRPAQAADSVENWLGLEEEEEEEEDDDDDHSDTAAHTPTLGSFIESRNKTTGTVRSGESGARHRIQDSTATIKQTDYWKHSAVRTLLEDTGAAAVGSAQSVNDKTDHTTMADPTLGTEKPLPAPPRHLEDASEMSVSSVRLPVRTSSLQSPQRPKKKVVWKGRSCLIAMPLNDGRGSHGAKLLTSADVQARLRRWEEEGCNTTGFVLGDVLEDNTSGLAGGQSRKIHPDPADMLAERRSHGSKVSIPDRAQWDAWMEFIKEEKLRALGVTTSHSEPPTSTQSPFPATISRASSQYPGMAFSPPQPPSSVGSNQLLQNGHMFPPHFNQSGASSQASSLTSPQPQFGGLPGPVHRYKPSVAYPPMETRMASPPNYPPTQLTPPGPRLQPSPHYFSPRQSSVSPAAVGMQSLGEVLSPVSPFPVESFGNSPQPSVMLDRMRRQQQDLQAQMLRQQQQQFMFNQSRAVNGPHGTPDAEKQFLARVEIAHPTPRPHQRNHSEALQREIDEAETLLEREAQGNGDLNEPNGKSPQTSLSLHEAALEQTKVSPIGDLDTVAAAQVAEAAERSEIETNPSLRTSPIPTERIQPPLRQPEPFEPVAPLPKDVSTAHTIKPSVSKLNVEAKEFKVDPKAAFLSTNFQINSTAFQPAAAPAQLNAAAPEFQPSTTTIIRPLVNRSNFSSPTFNVDAPEFNPSGSVASHFGSSIASGSDDPSSTTTSKIFGEINVDSSLKATRKSSKALPITKPPADKSDLDERYQLEYDDSGRLAPSRAGLKRLRRRGSDGDQDAVYAPHADQILMGQNVTNSEQNTESDSYKAPPSSAGTNKRSSPDTWEPFNFRDEVDISMFNSARPPHSVHPLPASAPSVQRDDPTSPAPTIDHQPKPSLSATAPPFVPISAQQNFSATVPTPEPVKPRKPMGLMASRFAATPSPPASPPLPASLDDVDELHKGLDVAPATENVLEPGQGLANSRILEEIVSEGHQSDATADDMPEPRQEFPKGGTLEEIVSEEHNSDTTDDVPKLQRQLPNGRILQEIVSDAHISNDTTDDVFEPKHERPHSRILREIVSDAHISNDTTDDVFEPQYERPHSRILREIVSEAHLSDAERSVPESHIDEGSVRSMSHLSSASETSDHLREPGPSYEEIDEVMKQLENDPELGVERLETPPARSSPAPTSQLPPFSNIRSDAPSPSPRRALGQHVPQERVPQMPFEDVEPGLESQVRKLLGNKDGDISDWNDEVSSPDAQKIHTRAQFFDAHVVDLVGGILDNRVGPMERTLKTIQHSLAVLATRPTSSRRERRSLSTDNRESDADDEDDYEDRDPTMRYQARSPTSRKEQRLDKLKVVVQDALAAHKAQILEAQGSDLSVLPEMLAEMRRLTQQVASESRQAELKAIVEDVIATHPRLRGHRVQQSHDFGTNEEKSKLQISGLETMLKMETERADHEAKSRRAVEDELAEALRQLKYAEEEAARHRESSEEAERTLLAYHKEKESLANLEQTVSELSLKNAALETTLEEYRLSSDQWRDDIHEERTKNKELRHAVHNLKRLVEESTETKQALRSKVDRLQENLAAAARDIASDQALSRKRELELVTKNEHLQNTLDHEMRRREKCELELDQLDKELKRTIQFRDRCDHLQQENARLEQAMAVLRQECKEAQDAAYQSQRELQYARESTERQVRQATSALEADLKLATSQANIARADLEAQISRLQGSLEQAELNAANAKEKHNALFEEALESHSRALQQAAEEKEAALQDQQAAHEKKLNDLRERHTRALHNSSDDRHRLEQHLNEKLALSDEKVQHLESKVVDLQERLDITKSAARAAVEAATAKGINLPTPASSVVASPPHSTVASMPLAKGSDIPEKISPQALRESIMVLQDQLQNREQRIEQLEAELAQVDREAPAKIKDRDTEITWLRELLGVRIDDLEDIIKSLSQQDYDREAVRDAAIRLRANLQMEQQEKERAASGVSNSFPSIASLTNLTQSPRALPMAAAAAWGNWRKARDSSLGALSDLTNLGNQTPSRSTFSGSPQSFLASLMTPPSTNQRQATPSAGSAPAPPTMLPLGAGGKKPGGEARTLRAYNAQVRSLSARRVEKQPSSSSQERQTYPEPPSTPPLMRRGSYDGDADVQGLDGDLDADASPIGGKENGTSGDIVIGEG